MALRKCKKKSSKLHFFLESHDVCNKKSRWWEVTKELSHAGECCGDFLWLGIQYIAWYIAQHYYTAAVLYRVYNTGLRNVTV